MELLWLMLPHLNLCAVLGRVQDRLQPLLSVLADRNVGLVVVVLDVESLVVDCNHRVVPRALFRLFLVVVESVEAPAVV